MQPSASGLSVRDVGMTFKRAGRETVALENCRFEAQPGAWISLIGASGCGKSTLLRIIADIVRPTSGSVSLGGQTPSAARASRAFALVSQQSTLLPWRRLLGNVELGLEIARVDRAERRRRAEEAIELVGLSGFEAAYPDELSGGMRQRAAIARALTLKPRFLLMDEPFGALDEITRERLNFELLRILQETEATLLLVTHSIPEAVILSDVALVMTPRPGRIASEIAIDFGRHRSPAMRDDPRFQAYEARLRHALNGEPEAAFRAPERAGRTSPPLAPAKAGVAGERDAPRALASRFQGNAR